MKKIILALLISFTALSADYIIKSDGSLTPATTQPPADEGSPTPPPADAWVGAALPTKAFNVLDYGLKGDGVTDDSTALNVLAKNTAVTNWYFPVGKSFLLSKITIPTHLDAIYGEGTIISKASDEGASTWGAFKITSGCKDGLIFDGLSFEAENSSNWPTGKSSYGHITFYGNTDFADLEIRNCTFDMEQFRFNGISGYEEEGGIISGLRIHHNTFNHITEMGIEIGDFSWKPTDGLSRHLIDVKLHDNTFNGPGGIALSYVQVRGGVGNTGVADGTESYIYNNIFVGTNWAMEIGSCSGVHVHNNIATGITDSLFSQSGNPSTMVTGKNFFYNNDLRGDADGAYLNLYGTFNDEYYNNYFYGRMSIDNYYGGEFNFNFHDNVFVYNIGTANASSIISINNITSGSPLFTNNKLYGSINAGRGFMPSGSTTNVTITDNEVYLKHPTGTCVDDRSSGTNTETDTTCKLEWTSDFPTSLEGAGLLR